MPKLLSGAEIVFKSLEDQKVEFIFGYPGGAVLPIYDELKNHKSIKHIKVNLCLLLSIKPFNIKTKKICYLIEKIAKESFYL